MGGYSNEDLTNIIEIICYSVASQTALTRVINKIPNEEFIQGYIIGFSKRILDSSKKFENYSNETYELILATVFKNFFNPETVNVILNNFPENLDNNETFRDGAYEAVEDADKTITQERPPVKLAMYIQKNQDLLMSLYSTSIENFYHKDKVYEFEKVARDHYEDYLKRTIKEVDWKNIYR